MSSPPHPALPVLLGSGWTALCCLGTLTVELQDTVRERGGFARDAWVGIEEQFLGNRETRALYLDAEFRAFVQGDLPICDYCRKMKGMADALGDLGEVITDCTLVLNVLRGLNAKYDHMKALLKRTRPFPTFSEVRNDLQLEELTLDPPASQPPTALLASQPKSSATNTSQVLQPGGPSIHGASNRAPGTGPSHHGAGAGSGSNGGKRHRRRGNGGKGGNGSQGSSLGLPSTTPGRAPSPCGLLVASSSSSSPVVLLQTGALVTLHLTRHSWQHPIPTTSLHHRDFHPC